MISAILLVTAKGDVLVSRIFRDDIPRGAADVFRVQVVAGKESRCPIKQFGPSVFIYILISNVYLVVVTNRNANIATSFELLHKLVDIFKAYFNGKFNEDSIRNNFVLIYELLDEIVDFGYPQTTTTDALKLYITQGKFADKKERTPAEMTRLSQQVTGAIPWRLPDVTYKKNQLFIDVIESVNMLVSTKGTILKADVSGKVFLKTMLSGMPECKLGINDRLLMTRESQMVFARRRTANGPAIKNSGILLDDITFHQCVRLGRFDSDRTITFIPPDGEFEIMRYRITENIGVPFRVIPIIKEIGKTRIEVQVTLKANFSIRLVGTLVVMKIPLPKNTAICKINVPIGKAQYQPAQDGIIWRIRRFPGATEATLVASVELTPSVSGKTTWSRPPICLQFTVPMFTASGLYVRFLKVVEQKLQYNTIKWVRYASKAGQYQYRI
eukprot:TRINITY_DN1022_c0_g3_i3.p1 TRINITY_DN1022_c0_g3~~TRINITY_DN1022_c0_g3_i3.p1  ORF type:complete len:441 (-),score=164.53 TRINITY_DN1022_c0_g3_i3:398-1720(-)